MSTSIRTKSLSIKRISKRKYKHPMEIRTSQTFHNIKRSMTKMIKHMKIIDGDISLSVIMKWKGKIYEYSMGTDEFKEIHNTMIKTINKH